MWIGGSIHNEDMNFVCQTHYIQMYKGKMFKSRGKWQKKIRNDQWKEPSQFYMAL